MKVGFVLDDTLDASDGVQQYVLLVGEWLRKHGHDVHYLVGESKRTDIPNVHSLSQNRRVRFNKNYLSIPVRVNKKMIAKLVKKGSWDVLHVQMPYSPLLAGRIISAAQPRTAVVGTFHIAPHSKIVTISTKKLGSLNKQTLKRFNAYISVSAVAQDFASTTFAIKSQVVPNAVDTVSWKPKKTLRNYDVVFVGRLVARKGCHLLLEAVRQIVSNDEYKDLTVRIAGDGPQRQRLESYVQKHGLQKNVKFLGYISEEEKKELLHSSRLAVYPSTGGESFGIVLIEAMAAGALVLGGDNPGYRSVLKGAPESIIPLDPIGIASTISRYLNDKKVYDRTLKKQQQIMKSFDVNTVGSDILAIYKEAIKDALKNEN